jgi:prevent-host-death family protein
MTIIGLKELRQNATDIVERAQKGERFTVVKRSKPVLTITAAQPEVNLDETAQWTEAYVNKHQKAFRELAQK